jgi:hypothetical protein
MVCHMRMYASASSTSLRDTLVTISSSNLNHGADFAPAAAACLLDSGLSALALGLPQQYLRSGTSVNRVFLGENKALTRCNDHL